MVLVFPISTRSRIVQVGENVILGQFLNKAHSWVQGDREPERRSAQDHPAFLRSFRILARELVFSQHGHR